MSVNAWFNFKPINNIVCFAGIFKQTVTGIDKLGRPYKQEIKTEAHKYCGGNGPKPAIIRRDLSIMMWIIMPVQEMHEMELYTIIHVLDTRNLTLPNCYSREKE